MLTNLMVLLRCMFDQVTMDEEGQGLVEYGLILALVAVVVITVLTTMGGNLNTMFSSVANKI